MNWFLSDKGLYHERIKEKLKLNTKRTPKVLIFAKDCMPKALIHHKMQGFFLER